MGGGKNITYIHNEMFEAFFRCRLFRRRRRHQRFINELNNEENNEKNKNPKKKINTKRTMGNAMHRYAIIYTLYSMMMLHARASRDVIITSPPRAYYV